MNKEQQVQKKITAQLDYIKSELATDRDISAILGSIGIIYHDEHIIALKYLQELGISNAK